MSNPFEPSGTSASVLFARAVDLMAERHALLLLDEHWIVTDCGRGVEAVLGFEGAELVGQPIGVLFDGLAHAAAFMHRLRATQEAQPFREDAWMLRRDGLRMWAEIACVVADCGADGRPRRFCLSARDATLQHRASLAMRGQADAAAAAVSARNLFLGSIAHEVRAALSPITMSASLLEQTVEPARRDRLLQIIRRNASTAARLMEDVLAFSTSAENKMSMRATEVDLGGVLVECTESVRPYAAASKVHLALELPATPDATLRCDPDRIQQVLMNLLGNAIKFTPAGGSVIVRAWRDAQAWSIEVADTGAGIDPLVLPFIFDPFEQGGAEVTKRFGGFGLGLAVSADIARQHGGKLSATSAGPGRGASFRLELPVAGVRPGRPGMAVRGPRALRVLFVEDDLDAADAMRYALGTLGWEMTHVSTCAGARGLLRDDEGRSRFDVVLADLGLPDGSGLDLGAEFCAFLPIIALSAYGAPLALQGFADQLIKPAEISEVQRAILQAVAGRQRTMAASR